MDFLKILEHHIINRPFLNFALAGIPITLTKHLLMLWIGAIGITAVLIPLTRKWPSVPTGARNLLEAIVLFIRDEVVLPNTGETGRRYLPFFLTIFFFILTVSLLGLIPGFSTATGNISVTAGFALCTFGLINYVGIREYGFVQHIKNFVPHGLPLWLFPLMLPLELISLLTKTFALCIRLFANMIAGHIVILAFLSLIFIFGSIYIAPESVAFALGIELLEIFVAFLQAYIFTLLSSIFVGASLHPH